LCGGENRPHSPANQQNLAYSLFFIVDIGIIAFCSDTDINCTQMDICFLKTVEYPHVIKMAHFLLIKREQNECVYSNSFTEIEDQLFLEYWPHVAILFLKDE